MPSLLDNLQRGGIYSLNVETAPTRLNLISQALCANLRNGIHCTFISPLPGTEFLARCEPSLAAELLKNIVSGQLLFFSMMGDYAKNIFRFGPEQFLKEIKHFNVPNNSFILCDQADSLFTLQDQTIAVDQVKLYRQWMHETNCTALFLFLRVGSESILSSNYQAITDYFHGAANFSVNNNTLELFAEFWRSPEGSLAARLIQLHLNGQGLVSVAPAQTALIDPQSAYANGTNYDPVKLNFTDESDIYFMGDDLEAFIPHTTGKRVSIRSLPSMLRESRDARTATILITYDKTMEFRQLTETVHALRVSLGNRVRLIVRESDTFLRYYNELLLLKIGANLIIHENVALARIPLLLESVRGQVYQHDTKFNFDEAIESILPTRKKGYLSPQRFCDEVESVLIQAQSLLVPCVLIVIRHPAGVDLLTSLNRFRISRNGDLITADANYCYVFLHACPEVHFRDTIARITGGNADDAVEGKDYFSKLPIISGKIDNLQQMIKQHPLPDLTQQMEAITSFTMSEPAPILSTAQSQSESQDITTSLMQRLNTLSATTSESGAALETEVAVSLDPASPYYRAPAARAHLKEQ